MSNKIREEIENAPVVAEGGDDNLLAWADKQMTSGGDGKKKPAKKPADNPQAREKIRRAAQRARTLGYDIPDEVADDFYDLTALESGRAHYLPDGKTVKTGVRTPNGDFAIGFSQVMGNTAKKYKPKNLDPYNEDDNILMGLNEFYETDPKDPVARRIGYVAGPASGALKKYRQTGEVPDSKLYNYLPKNKETFETYVEHSGGYKGVQNWAENQLNGGAGNNADQQQNLLNWADQQLQPQQQAADNPANPSPTVQGTQTVKTPADTNSTPVLENLKKQQADFQQMLQTTPKSNAKEQARIRRMIEGNARTIQEEETRQKSQPPPQQQQSQSGLTQPPLEQKPAPLPDVVKDAKGNEYYKSETPAKDKPDTYDFKPELPEWITRRSRPVTKFDEVTQKEYEAALKQYKADDSEEMRQKFQKGFTDADLELILSLQQQQQQAPNTQEFQLKQEVYGAPQIEGVATENRAEIETVDPQTVSQPKLKSTTKLSEFGNSYTGTNNVFLKFNQAPSDEDIRREGIRATYGDIGVEADRAFRQATGNPLISLTQRPQVENFRDQETGAYRIPTEITRLQKFDDAIKAYQSGGVEAMRQAFANAGNQAYYERLNEQNLAPDGVARSNGEFLAPDEFGAVQNYVTGDRRRARETQAQLATEQQLQQSILNPSTTDVLKTSAEKSFFTPAIVQAKQLLFDDNYGLEKPPETQAELSAAIEQRKTQILQQFGSFNEYQKARTYVENMSGLEYSSRLLTSFVRGTVQTAVSSQLKGIDTVDALFSKINPLDLALPENKIVSPVRLVSNLLGYTIASAMGKGDQFEAATADTPVDRRLFYSIGENIDKALGQDKYLREDFWNQVATAGGSAAGFMMLGFLAPEAQIATRIGNLSVASGVAGAVSTAGTQYDEAKKGGASEKGALLAGAFGLPLGATEMFGIGSVLNRALDDAGKGLFVREWTKFVKELGKDVLRESGEETLQEFVQSTGGKIVLDYVRNTNPNEFARLTETILNARKHAAETLIKEVPVAALTGGAMGGSTRVAAGFGQLIESTQPKYDINALRNSLSVTQDPNLVPLVESYDALGKQINTSAGQLKSFVDNVLNTATDPQQIEQLEAQLQQMVKQHYQLADEQRSVEKQIQSITGARDSEQLSEQIEAIEPDGDLSILPREEVEPVKQTEIAPLAEQDDDDIVDPVPTAEDARASAENVVVETTELSENAPVEPVSERPRLTPRVREAQKLQPIADYQESEENAEIEQFAGDDEQKTEKTPAEINTNSQPVEEMPADIENAPAPAQSETVNGSRPRLTPKSQGKPKVQGIQLNPRENIEQAPNNTIEKAGKTPTSTGDELENAAVELYQWQRNKEGGQQFGNQTYILPLTEELFQKYIADKLRKGFAKNLESFQEKTGEKFISLVKRADKDELLFGKSAPTIEEVRPNKPQWAKKVVSFSSDEARVWGETADSEAELKPQNEIDFSGYTDEFLLSDYKTILKDLGNEHQDVIDYRRELEKRGISYDEATTAKQIDESKIVNPIDLNLSPEEKVEALKKLSDENVPLVEKILARVEQELGLESKWSHKDPQKILNKAKRPMILAEKPWHNVEHIRDSLRFKAKLETFDDALKIAQIFADEGIEIVKTDTRKMIRPKEWGWRFMALDLRFPNGQLVEFYAPFKELDSKDVKGPNHDLFEKWREKSEAEILENFTEYETDIQESRARYGAAWQEAIKRNGYESEEAAAAAWTKVETSLSSVTGSNLSLSSSTPITPRRQLPSDSRTIGEDKTSKSSLPGKTKTLSESGSRETIIETPTVESITQNKPLDKDSAENSLQSAENGAINETKDDDQQQQQQQQQSNITDADEPVAANDRGHGDEAETGSAADVSSSDQTAGILVETDAAVSAVDADSDGADAGAAASGGLLQEVQSTDRGRNGSADGETNSGDGDPLSPDTGTADADGDGNQLDSQPPTKQPKKPAKNPGDAKRVVGTTGNFYVNDLESFQAGGLKQKFRNNVAAIETLRKIEAEGRETATPEEQAILAKYIGWGQFPALFNTYNEKGESWDKERETLLNLISAEEFDAASGSTKNAHYTAPQVVRLVWEVVEKLGFKGGRAVETSMGVGNFFFFMPPDLRGNTRVTGIELDPLSAKIARLLFPAYDIRQMGYEEFAPPKGYYDLAISNVPFGNYQVADQNMPYFLRAQIHNYFFAKSLENVRPGGLIAFITSTGTMSNEEVLKYLAGKADLVTAIRFPGNTFLKEAGTAVVTDLVILRVKNPGFGQKALDDLNEAKNNLEGFEKDLKEYQKQIREIKAEKGKEAAELSELYLKEARVTLAVENVTREVDRLQKLVDEADRFANTNWTEMTSVPDPDGGEDIPVNKYFVDNPKNILGRLDRTGKMYGGNSINVARTPDFEERVAELLNNIPKNVVLDRESEAAEAEQMQAAPASMRQGSLIVRDGKLYSREGSFLKERPVTSKHLKNITALLEVRDALNEVAAAERTNDRKAADNARKVLNDAYDEYVKKHGTIYENRQLIQIDPDHYRLLALEVFDKKTKKVTGKSDIFTQPTVSKLERATRADNYSDALNIVLNQTGRVDLEQIASLMNSTVDDAKVELVEQGLAFNDPRDGWTVKDFYLSGEVRRKLREAREAAVLDPEFKPNIVALEKVQPEDLPYRRIEPTLGAVWIPADDIKQFMADMMTEAGQSAQKDDFLVERLGTGDWLVGFKDKTLAKSSTSTNILGTEDRDFADIIAAAIRDMPIEIRRSTRDGSYKDTRASMLANRKVKEIRKKFKKWVWSNDERRARLHRAFNDSYNDTRKLIFNGQHLTFPGMNPLWAAHLRPHVQNAVYRTLITGRILAAHEVGTGKTNLMIMTAMELRRLKLAKKPAIVCLNANVAQVADAARELYPNAKILSAFESMDAETRKETSTRIMSGDWDIVILTHENLMKIPMSRERQVAFINEELTYLRDQVRAAEALENEANAATGGYSYGRKSKKSDNRVVKALEAKIANRQAKLQQILGSAKKDDVITFEETGIDFLMVDEAHAFKNLDIQTTRQGTKGIPSTDSQRALNMFMVTRYLTETHNGRGVGFYTGTPISNTTAEAFNMMRYLMYNDLKARGIHHFDSWAANYGENVAVSEMGPDGTLKTVTSFRRFKNMETLSGLLGQVMDVVWADDVGDIKRPKRIDEIITSPMSEQQQEYQQELVARAEALKKMTKSERMAKGADNWLAIGTHARWMAIDMRLLKPDAVDDAESKVNKMVQKILETQKENPGKVQLIFSNVGVNPTSMNPKFRLYGDIINKLVAGGIPRNKIIDFSKFKSSKKLKDGEEDDGASVGKEEAMRRLNSGDAWIAIGSTEKLGTGVNVQEKVVAMHKLDVKHRPDQDEQETGRGHRHGNQHDVVYQYRYTTEDSFDMHFYDRLKQKKGFIDQLLRGEVEGEFLDTIDESLDYDTVVAVTASNPLIRERIEVIKQLRELEEDFESFNEDLIKLRDARLNAQRIIKENEQYIADIEEDRAAALKNRENRIVSIADSGRAFTLEPEEEIREKTRAVEKIRREINKEFAAPEDVKEPKEDKDIRHDLAGREFERRVSELPKLEAEKASDAIRDQIQKVREQIKTNYNVRYRILHNDDGRVEIGEIFGFPVYAVFEEVKKSNAITARLYLRPPSGRYVRQISIESPIAEAQSEINSMLTASIARHEKAIREFTAEIPRIEKRLEESKFENEDLLNDLRKKLTRIEIELGGEVIPEGYQDVEQRMNEITDEQLKQAFAKHLKTGVASGYGKYVGTGQFMVIGDKLPETEEIMPDQAQKNMTALLDKIQDYVGQNKNNDKVFIQPVAVDLGKDNVLFTNGQTVPALQYKQLFRQQPEAEFVSYKDEKYIVAVDENRKVVGVLIPSNIKDPGGEDLLPAIRRAKYLAQYKKEKRRRELEKNPFVKAARTQATEGAKTGIESAVAANTNLKPRVKQADAEPHGLFKKLSDEAAKEDKFTFDEMLQLPYLPFDELLQGAETEVTGDRVRANAKSHEIYRRTLEESRIRRGDTRVGSKDAEDLFGGLFWKPETVQAVAEILREKAAEARRLGYSADEIAVFETHARAIEEASNAGSGTAIVYVFESALPEEIFHQADYLGAVEKSLLNRHDEQSKRALDAHQVTGVLWEKHFSRFRDYKNYSASMRKAVLRAEIAPLLLEMSAEDLKALGLSEDLRDDYLLTWFEGYARKNDSEAGSYDSLKTFEKDELNVQRFTERLKRANARSKIDETAPVPAIGGDTDAAATEPVESREISGDSSSGSVSSEAAAPGIETGSRGNGSQPADAADNDVQSARLELGENQKYASLPATMRAAGLEAEDLVYEVFGDVAARESAIKMLQENGIEGSKKLLNDARELDVDHAILSFMLQRILLDRAAAIETIDPAKAEQMRREALDLGKEHANKAIAAGRFTRAASIIQNSVEGVVYTGVKIKQDHPKHGGKDATLSPDERARLEAVARQAEEALAKIVALKKDRANLLAKIRRLETVKEEQKKEQKDKAAALRKKVVETIREKQSPAVDAIKQRILARLQAAAEPDSLKSAIAGETEPLPSLGWVKRNLKVNLVPFHREVLDAFVVGSVARGTARPDSDIDIAVIVPPVRNKTSIKISEEYHSRILHDSWKPRWNGRIVDFQFFYESDSVLSEYTKLPLANKRNETEPDTLKHAINGFTDEEIDELAQVGGMMLIEGIAGGTDYLPEHFRAEMIATFGNIIDPQFNEIYRKSFEQRDKWLNETRQEKRAGRIRKKYGENLTDDEVAEILGEISDRAKHRRAVETLHKVTATKDKPSKRVEELAEIIDDLAENAHTARAAKLLSESKPKAEILSKLIGLAPEEKEKTYLDAVEVLSFAEKALASAEDEDADASTDPVRERIDNIRTSAREAKKAGRREYAETLRKIRSINNIYARIQNPKQAPKNVQELADVAAELAAGNANAAVAATLLARNVPMNDIFEILGAGKASEQREILRAAGELLEKSKKELAARKKDQRNAILKLKGEKQSIDDLLFKARQEAMKAQRAVGDELKRIKSNDLAYYAKNVYDATNAMRTMMASLDLSAALRQGGFFSIAKPEAQGKAFANMMKSFAEKGYGRAVQELEANPHFTMAQRAGIDFAIAGKSADEKSALGEELYKGEETIEKLWFFGPIIKKAITGWSERTYTAFLDTQRMVMFEMFAKELEAAGLTMLRNKPEFEKIAQFVNVATGRGAMPQNKFAKLIIDLPLFAPRYTLSRFQLLNMTLNPVAYYNMPPHARNIVMRSAGRFYGTVGVVAAIAAAAGVMAIDPDDDDFMKIKIGNSRYDIFVGMLQPAKLMIRLALATARGDRIPGETYHDVSKALERFIRGKLSPVASGVVDWYKGSDFVGNEFGYWRAIYSRLIPLTVSELIQSAGTDGVKGVAKTLPFAFFGIGVQTYEGKPEAPKTAAEKLAAKAVAMQIVPKPRSDEDRAAQDLVAKLKARSRAGEDVAAEATQAIVEGKIKADKMKEILEARDKSYLIDKAEGLSLESVAAVYRVAGAEEKKQLQPLFDEKMKNKEVEGTLTPEARAEYEKLGGRVLGDAAMPDPVKTEFQRFRMATPDVGKDYTAIDGSKQKFSTDEYAEYRKQALENIYRQTEQLINNPDYQKASPQEQEKLFRSMVNTARGEIRDQFKATELEERK